MTRRSRAPALLLLASFTPSACSTRGPICTSSGSDRSCEALALATVAVILVGAGIFYLARNPSSTSHRVYGTCRIFSGTPGAVDEPCPAMSLRLTRVDGSLVAIIPVTPDGRFETELDSPGVYLLESLGHDYALVEPGRQDWHFGDLIRVSLRRK